MPRIGACFPATGQSFRYSGARLLLSANFIHLRAKDLSDAASNRRKGDVTLKLDSKGRRYDRWRAFRVVTHIMLKWFIA
jgi:hypothetical protein